MIFFQMGVFIRGEIFSTKNNQEKLILIQKMNKIYIPYSFQ